jgi:stage IV sporulation protein FB
MFRFAILGTKIELHYSFFLLLCMIILSGNSEFGVASAVFSFLHEIAHKTTAKFLGYTPEKISMGLFGGILHIREGFVKPLDELLIHLAGPFFNIVTAALLYGVYAFFPVSWIEPVILANLVLGIFNLMPFYPLDGGKIIDLYLAIFLGYGRSQKISRFFSIIFSLFLFLLGIYLVQYNVLNLLISALAINLYVASRQDNSFIFYKVSRNIEEGSKNAKSKIVVCRESVKAIKVLEKYKPMENRLFTIVNDKGSYKGQLTEEELLNGIYHCGYYADFQKLLKYKKIK